MITQWKYFAAVLLERSRSRSARNFSTRFLACVLRLVRLRRGALTRRPKKPFSLWPSYPRECSPCRLSLLPSSFFVVSIVSASRFACARAIARTARCTEERGIPVAAAMPRTLRPSPLKSSTTTRRRRISASVPVCAGFFGVHAGILGVVRAIDSFSKAGAFKCIVRTGRVAAWAAANEPSNVR